eukprot:1110876-Rhodomonas_salina.1
MGMQVSTPPPPPPHNHPSPSPVRPLSPARSLLPSLPPSISHAPPLLRGRPLPPPPAPPPHALSPRNAACHSTKPPHAIPTQPPHAIIPQTTRPPHAQHTHHRRATKAKRGRRELYLLLRPFASSAVVGLCLCAAHGLRAHGSSSSSSSEVSLLEDGGPLQVLHLHLRLHHLLLLLGPARSSERAHRVCWRCVGMRQARRDWRCLRLARSQGEQKTARPCLEAQPTWQRIQPVRSRRPPPPHSTACPSHSSWSAPHASQSGTPRARMCETTGARMVPAHPTHSVQATHCVHPTHPVHSTVHVTVVIAAPTSASSPARPVACL